MRQTGQRKISKEVKYASGTFNRLQIALAAGKTLCVSAIHQRRLPIGPHGALALSCILIAAGSGLTTPSVSSYVSRSADPEVQGLMLGTLQSLSALARVLGPAVGGLLYQVLAPPAPYLAGALGLAAAAWLSLRLASLSRKPGLAPAVGAPPSEA